MQFKITQIGTTSPVAESTRVPRTSNLAPSGTLPLTGNIYSENKHNRTATYLAKTTIQEALDEEGEELEDIEAQEMQEVAQQA